jgi:cytochrome c biogenesis protein CcmG, thiol:disulfide interchange protein DsbE
MRRWLPLIVFAAIAVMLYVGLDPKRDPRLLPSALIGKPFPAGNLPQLEAPDAPVQTASLKGKPFVVNVFASWCRECVVENPALIEFGRTSEVPLIGLAFKDEPDATRAFLSRWGNPFDQILTDQDGRFGIELGIYGAPETFFVDGSGVVRAKHVGALTIAELREQVGKLGAASTGASQ